MVQYIAQNGSTKEISEPTGGLRFVLREGRRILQQQFTVTVEFDGGNPDGSPMQTQMVTRWQDVPLEQM